MSGAGSLAAAIAALLEHYGIPAAPGRAEKLAAALGPMLERSAADTAEHPPEYSEVSNAERWHP